MKTLYIVRHAKSSWADPDLVDLERPLNKRGQRDAPFMAKLLHGKGVQVDKLISSPAKRAHETAVFFAKQWKISGSHVSLDKQIYEGTPSRLLEKVHEFSNEWNTVFLFGHNPTLTSFINLFAKDYLANLPTCGIARLEADVDDWRLVDSANTNLAELYYPRQFFPKQD
ncbi:MAG: histidine phosphatase family protein [Saprospirales bacterium]|nr:histidine phosphatase family protein [Saprospirales bacterium]MBK8492279.1 histidine phosphatase family protein [Saprospirales bacterium]